eukprot:CAMPEP_0197029272 /NCGR_PEP_ID=MMETSP1384-20130603/8762_1 /TAXON_ID=29189 /ORGANISM="Ammonia sp." /LENGTH=259 /DNA_ID=CAMNT_0042458405 /DNA_START=29 /DNA_END=808 /DNA_ORIENTATION=+
MSSSAIFFISLLYTPFAINDPTMSNYMIAHFSVSITNQVIPQPFPVDYCVQQALFGSYVRFECSDDQQSITKRTYSSSDSTCTGSEVEATETYTQDPDMIMGHLHDFNCAGTNNRVGYHAYFACDSTPAGTAWMATDVCFKYLNLTNITSPNYPHLPWKNQHRQLSQRTTCNGTTVTMNTYLEEGCASSPEWTSFSANEECGFYFERQGFAVYAAVIDCVIDGNSTSTTTTANPDSASSRYCYWTMFVITCVLGWSVSI